MLNVKCKMLDVDANANVHAIYVKIHNSHTTVRLYSGQCTVHNKIVGDHEGFTRKTHQNRFGGLLPQCEENGFCIDAEFIYALV